MFKKLLEMSDPGTQIDDDREWIQIWIEDEELVLGEEQFRRNFWPGYIEHSDRTTYEGVKL